MKYKKLPIEIEAFKWDGDMIDKNGKWYVPVWAQKAWTDGTFSIENQGELYIKTLDSFAHVDIGDFIVRDIDGKLYPCDPDLFEKTYVRVEE